ncbi:hypothetical protein L1987_16199 [Smallanthus sonchifolius]|uniref:Uncharacterized protein n=1 Tax=Smallanthus sonchifolius TaxID=185202 RepID=A0ACB9JAC5_9ASTR|nr:hypothetical protein L1987_16199 [Smallanthus sonchifolius]
MGKHLKPEPFDRQLRDAFKVIDKEGTEHVVVADLKHILTSIGEKLEPAEFNEWIREINVGSDEWIHRLGKVQNLGRFCYEPVDFGPDQKLLNLVRISYGL